ncbi:MAG: protease SohB [Myxococcota bacterium]
MEHLVDYGIFLLKVATVAFAVLFVWGAILKASRRGFGGEDGELRVRRLNDAVRDLGNAIRKAALPKKAWKQERKADKERKKQEKQTAGERKRIFVLDFDGDLKATAVESLRREITAVLAVARDGDEVMLKLKSAGGLVYGYGLAASQLERITRRGLRLTAVVDKIAASGGYMMACVADHVVAAPFAIVGSIGVAAAVPNVHRLLKNHDVDVEYMTAGEYKRTLTLVAENTDKGRRKFQEQMDDTHGLFKEFVKRHRPEVDLDRVATGEHWYGSQGAELNLVDEVSTSDDWLIRAVDDADLLQVSWEARQGLGTKLAGQVDATLRRVLGSAWQASHERRYL